MPHICETRAGKARASRNSFVGWFRDPLIRRAHEAQPLLHLIASQLGRDWLSGWAAGSD